MKKFALSLLAACCCTVAFSQKMMTRSGEIKFEASMPALEEVAATNKGASCVFDYATGDLATLALINGFKFKVPLMEEHFNENYMETEKFPKATFKGKVLKFDAAKFTAKTVYDVEGDLTIHGVTQKVKTKMTLTPSGKNCLMTGTFTVKAKDYDIKIPSVVKSKIAEDIKVAVNFSLEPK